MSSAQKNDTQKSNVTTNATKNATSGELENGLPVEEKDLAKELMKEAGEDQEKLTNGTASLGQKHKKHHKKAKKALAKDEDGKKKSKKHHGKKKSKKNKHHKKKDLAKTEKKSADQMEQNHVESEVKVEEQKPKPEQQQAEVLAEEVESPHEIIKEINAEDGDDLINGFIKEGNQSLSQKEDLGASFLNKDV